VTRQLVDVTEPGVGLGLVDTGVQIVLNISKPPNMRGIDLEELAADAPLTELTVGCRLVGGRLRGGVASLSA
jgi:hypothetical protein